MGCLQPREVPQRRRTQTQMWIVGQQGRARGGALPRQDPVVGAGPFNARGRGDAKQVVQGGVNAGRAARQRWVVGLGQPQFPVQGHIVARGGVVVSWVGRQHLFDALGIQHGAQAQAHQLRGPVAPEVPGHHQTPGQAVDRCPWLRPDPQEPELRWPHPRVGHRRIHPGGIGLQQFTAGRPHPLPLGLCRAAHPQSPQEPIVVQRGLTKHLGQAPRANPALGLHLPQAVLRVDEAQGIGGIGQAVGRDGRYAVCVALDANAGAQFAAVCRHGRLQNQFAGDLRFSALEQQGQGQGACRHQRHGGEHSPAQPASTAGRGCGGRFRMRHGVIVRRAGLP